MLHGLVPHDSDLGFFLVLFYEGFFLLLSFLEEYVEHFIFLTCLIFI